MTEAEKKMKKYVNEVERRLELPLEVKARVMSDFVSSIIARREAGQTDEAIFSELGSPKKAASELNEQMKEFACKKTPWRFAFLAAAVWGWMNLLPGIFGAAAAALIQLKYNVLTENGAASVGIIGGADGPTAIFLTSQGWNPVVLYVALALTGTLGYLWLKKKK